MTAPLRLVLAGGGHSQIEVLRQFAIAQPDLSLTLITRDPLVPYSGMLPGFIAGHYAYEDCHIDVRGLAHMAHARLCLATVEGIDLERKVVQCAGRPAIPFDLLSLNIGSQPATEDVPGADTYAWPAKPVDTLIRNWQALLADLEARPRAHRIVTVGGGAGGVELTLSMQYALRNITPRPQFGIVSATADLLPSHNAGARARMERVLRERGVEIFLGESAAEVTAGEVHCASGKRVPFDTLIWTTHAAAAPWLRTSGLTVDERGFAVVNEALQSVSHDCVFAAGDTASLADSPQPKSGVFAVREGPYLARNLLRAAAGQPLEAYKPQKEHLSLIGTGDRRAIASRGRWSAGGTWVWRWKNYIDRKWMNRYRYIVPSMGRLASATLTGRLTLGEAMENPDVNAGVEIPCAGAGANLGNEFVQRAIARLGLQDRPDVLVGLDAPDGAAVVVTPGNFSVYAADFFPPLLDDAFLSGKIAANHCLSDIYAAGASPSTASVLATLPDHEASQLEDELVDLLAGALSVLAPEQTALTGIRALQGDTTLFGLNVNGVLDKERLPALRPPVPGEVLIVTKPLGIGAIFAADMRGLAQNDWLADAIAIMTQSNAAAARILFEHGTTLCTRIGGFGLVVQLLRLLRASDLAASLDLAQVPVLPGALAATVLRIRSSLYPANAAAQKDIATAPGVTSAQAYPLLFDPQTAGGFVAAVPAERADACVATLRAAGYTYASRIGTLCAATPGQPLLSV